jgi:nucleotide-binding universal stress UspA family protein
VASSGTGAPSAARAAGPVLFAYDGSELAKLAIEQAGRQLAPGREALVVCVWQPGDVGFVPPERHLNAAEATEVRSAAEETAAHGGSLAEKAGFQAQSMVIRAAPTWKGIIEVAEERKASLIVLGSHRRSGLEHLLGSVTAGVMAHSASSVLVVRGRS